MLESGIVYSFLIDPLLGGLRRLVAVHVKSGETVIDIACGTGAQLFELANKTASSTGIDISESMVRFAARNATKRNLTNITFEVHDATDLSHFYNRKFDVAILSMALHQFSPDLHSPILSEIKKIAERLIILDYAVPLPKNYAGMASKIAEFLAGTEHHRNFKNYVRAGGLNAVLTTNGFTIQKSKLLGGGAFHLVTVHHQHE